MLVPGPQVELFVGESNEFFQFFRFDRVRPKLVDFIGRLRRHWPHGKGLSLD